MPEITPSKHLTQAGWADVPHITEAAKSDLRNSTMPHLRDAREHGTPSLGAGAIYQVPVSEFAVDPFQIPRHWPRCYALDVGWKRTACLWLAKDSNTDTVYAYTEHYRGQAEPSIHATAIKARGLWIPGVIDPAAHGRGQKDGEQLYEMYRQLGLNIENADNSIESGIYMVWERLSTGRFKVFKTCANFIMEYRNYRRDEHGSIVKEDDHLMDCARYGVVSGLARAIAEPVIGFGRGVGSASGGDSTVGY